jgi:hypothetical protein
MTPAALSFSADSLVHEIVHIERIADEEEGLLQVYLIEIKRVTVALIQAMARALRNRAGNFLLVLTTDYEELDFVLMELTQPESKRARFGALQAYLRPRTLTVDRRDPSSVDLRVLRRFSYTEADADYQIQKLLSAYNTAEWSEPFFNNRALFSDYYLTNRLKDTLEWNESLDAAYRALQQLYAGVREKVWRKNEATVRAQLLEPVLRALGFDLRPGKSSASDAVEPDYYLLATDHPPVISSSHGEKSLPLTEQGDFSPSLEMTNGAVAYCDAYVWDRNLDGPEARDLETPEENPGALVVSLLQKEGAPGWAIVTNGKLWRLYSARAHSRATNYYEIDLEEALASPDPQFAFRYFWLMFRAQAFVAKPQSFLNRLLEESALYAKELEERLKERVFEEIFVVFPNILNSREGG